MTPAKSDRTASRPDSIWLRPVEADIRNLFTSLTSALANILTLKWKDALEQLLEAARTVHLRKDVGGVAWLLVYKAMSRAVYEIIDESTDIIAERKEPTGIVDDLLKSVKFTEFPVDSKFFDKPQELPIVQEMNTILHRWLVQIGVEETKARATANRLPGCFVYALINEWRKRSDLYSSIKEALDSPFIKASERETAWAAYLAWLQRLPDERMFGEAFGIRSVYVPLRSYYVEEVGKGSKSGMEESERRTSGQKRIVVDLETYLENWINAGKKNDALKVISGGPGSGKSCFAKIFAAKLAASGRKVLYIPLHLLDMERRLEPAVGKYAQDVAELVSNPLSSDDGEKQLIIIFDGLDELAKQGRVGAEIAREFVEEVDRTVGRRNSRECHLQIIISGRELVVQKNESQFREEQQISYLLPYYLPKSQRGNFQDSKKRLEVDQRHDWWKNYSTAIGLPEDKLPDPLLTESLEDITAQPLLNYLVALSYNGKNIDFAKDVSLNEIYADLLKQVWKRGYEHRPFEAIKELKEEEFNRLLQDIGLAAWHGDSRSATLGEIEKHCSTADAKCLEGFKEGAKSGVTRLLTAFYFRRSESMRGSEETFEFTHKSFGEYLAAMRIIRALEQIEKMLTGDIDLGLDERYALARWAEITGPVTMERDLFRFVSNEIKLRGKENASKWQEMIIRLINHLLRHGMPMEKLDPRPKTFKREYQMSRNSEEALLTALSACAETTKMISKIEWPELNSAGDWINRLRGQRNNWENTLALDCLHHLCFETQVLFVIDLENACLEGASFKAALLLDANFWNTDFENANLEHAKLEFANIVRANLKCANLGYADLEGANLEGANLEGANLEGANLEAANLKHAILPNTVEKIKKITKWNDKTIWPKN